jgi:hypothetical protein
MRARSLLPCLAALLVAALTFPTAPAAAPAATATRPCAASGLVVWAGEAPGGATAGSVYYRIELTNLSTTCTVKGFPKVNAVNLKGARIGAFATHETSKNPKLVTLAPGQSATATLRIVDALNFPADKCKATTAAGLRIAIPAGSGNKIAPLAFETCARSVTKTLSVGPVRGG